MIAPRPSSPTQAPSLPRATATIVAALLLSALWVEAVEGPLRVDVDASAARLAAAQLAAPSARLSPGEVAGLPDGWRAELGEVVSEVGPPDEALSAAAQELQSQVQALPSWRWGWVSSSPSPWGWLTYIFIHGDLFHLLSNLALLWLLASGLEARWGPQRLSLLFLGAGAAGALAHLLAAGGSSAPLVGASAGVAGCLGAVLAGRAWAPLEFVFLNPVNARAAAAVLSIPLGALVLVWVSLEALALTDPGPGPSALPAHLGGLALGALAGVRMRSRHGS